MIVLPADEVCGQLPPDLVGSRPRRMFRIRHETRLSPGTYAYGVHGDGSTNQFRRICSRAGTRPSGHCRPHAEADAQATHPNGIPSAKLWSRIGTTVPIEVQAIRVSVIDADDVIHRRKQEVSGTSNSAPGAELPRGASLSIGPNMSLAWEQRSKSMPRCEDMR